MEKKFNVAFIAIAIFCLSPLNGKAQTSHKNQLSQWYKSYNDSTHGANIDEAFKFLKQNKQTPPQKIIVGIIDSGIDTLSTDLKDALWTNSKEKPDGKDNDRNGYIDDIHGWNFLGTKDKSFNMISAGTEEFRQFKRLYPKYKNLTKETATDKAEFDFYEKMKKKAGIESYIKFYQYNILKLNAIQKMDSILRKVSNINRDTLTIKALMSLPIKEKEWESSTEMILGDLLQSDKDELWKNLAINKEKELGTIKKRIDSIERDPDKRLLMGDNMENASDRFYGNSVLQIDGYDHGTFIAGVIAGQGIVNKDYQGVYPDAKLMILRSSPNGDEYDKDIASAIRYAVENGAKVINMSLGKYTSPNPQMVNDAIAYAAKKDVIIVQAAGNNGKDIDSIDYFPTGKNNKGILYPNFIRVGSTDRKGNICRFSNYGKNAVQIYAPGEDIISVMPGNEYAASQGTSISAPIVCGIVAMLRAYFPKLKAAQIVDIIKRSGYSTNNSAENNVKCINALTAVKLAMTYKK